MSVAERGPRKEKRTIAVGDRVKRLGRGKGGKIGTVVELIASHNPSDAVPRVAVRWDDVTPSLQIWPADILVIVNDETERA
jgi:hypothetical protein